MSWDTETADKCKLPELDPKLCDDCRCYAYCYRQMKMEEMEETNERQQMVIYPGEVRRGLLRGRLRFVSESGGKHGRKRERTGLSATKLELAKCPGVVTWMTTSCPAIC